MLLGYDELVRAVSRVPGVERTAGLVTVAARVEIAGRAQSQPLFGVDFAEYAAMFPRLRLVRGSLPAPGTPGILIHESRFAELTRALGLEPELGTPVLLSVFNNYSFTIREVPLAGVFTYPVSDPLLDRVGLIDVQTARSLNGYVYGSREPGSRAGTRRRRPGRAVRRRRRAGPGGRQPGSAAKSKAACAPANLRARRTPEPREGAWNFLLIRLADGLGDAGAGRIARELRSAGFPGIEEIQVRDWRHSAGGNAMLVWIVQILLNAGLIFIAAGAAIVAVNALALSVLERTREIGTMRAIGASRGRVGFMISAETLVLVAGAGVLGIGGGNPPGGRC